MQPLDFKRARHPDPGSAFQQFVGEFFVHAHPQLANFLSGGKDGAIDCHAPRHGGVWESKYIAEDGIEAARGRWQEVADHLRKNLLDHQPRTGQGQYRPWYDTVCAIRQYHFCVSSRLANRNQQAELARDIGAVFAELSRRQGLAHLAAIEVTVWSLDSFEPALSARPGLRMRWFGSALPNGVRFANGANTAVYPGFRAYLHGTDRIRYVSLGGELAPESLAASLKHFPRPASVLIGRGGSGKSRLLLEVGRAAESLDWAVFTLDARRADPAALEQVLREAGEAPALLLMDYMERCETWDQWLGVLEDRRADGLTVHLLGSCRDSWKERLDRERTKLIPLAASQESTVAGILAQRTGLGEYQAQCRNVPVFAAFLCLLYDKSREQSDAAATLALEELRQQPEFEHWLQEHVAALPGRRSEPDALATLLIHLPCSQESLLALEAEQADVAVYRQRLSDDGWLLWDPDADPGEAWGTLHDVLADGALAAWARRHSVPNAQLQMEKWLAQARRIGSLAALLRCLQRNAGDDAVAALPWRLLFDPRQKDAWRDWRDPILRTHLLPPAAAFAWLAALEGRPPAGLSFAILFAVGDALAVARTDSASVDAAILQEWADAAAAALTRSAEQTLPRATPNRTLKEALLWRPTRYAEAVGRWLDCEASQEQAQFLLNAWNGLPPALCDRGRVLAWLHAWLRDRPFDPLASFVFKDYLRSGQTPGAIRQDVNTWLGQHRTLPEAQFVLKGWLDAGGGTELVREDVAAWLGQHRTLPGAGFVLKGWLDAGGGTELVREDVVAWLRQHRSFPEAGFVLRAWLDAGGGTELVREDVASWLGQHRHLPEAQFVLKGWLDAGGGTEPVREHVVAWLAQHRTLPEAGFVLTAWLDAGGGTEPVREDVAAWLRQHRIDAEASHVLKAWLDAGGKLALIENDVRAWFEAGDNALSEGAGFLVRSFGNRDAHLPDWLIPHACAWVRQHRLSHDAVYPVKYVAGLPGLDAETARAIADWCARFSDDDDALFRFSRLHHHYGGIPERETLIRTGLAIIEATLSRHQGQRGHGDRWLRCLAVLAELFALPWRTVEERGAGEHIPGTVCAVVRQWAQTPIPESSNMSLGWVVPLASADWERMVSLGGGPVWDEALRAGVRRWARWCMSFTQYEDQIPALERLLARAG